MDFTKERRNKRINADTTQMLITYSAIITSIIAFLFLPDHVPIKFIPSDLVDDPGEKIEIFFLPLLVFLLGIVITFRPKNPKMEQESRKAYVVFIRVITMLMTMILGVQLLYAFGVTFALTILNVVVGAAMVFVGIRVRANRQRFSFRIKTKWMVKYELNREATEKWYWQAAVVFGVSQIAIAALFADYYGLGSGIVFTIIWLLGTIIYSNRFHKKNFEEEVRGIDEGPIREDHRDDD